MGNPNQLDLGGMTLVVSDIVLASTPGGSQTSLSATEIAALDGVTAGTAAASKALVLNSSSGITTGLTLLTATTVTAANVGVTTLTPTTIAGAANFTGTPTLAAGATVTGTVTATGQFSGGLQPTIIEDGAAVVLTAPQSGALCIFDKIDGALFTLPTPAVGLYYDFCVVASVTSNSMKVITNAGSVFIIGSVDMVDTDTTFTHTNQDANGSTHVAVTMAAASTNSTGGIKGTRFRLTCRTATSWVITGQINHAGTVGTPFTTS